jgi:hypothetical protein
MKKSLTALALGAAWVLPQPATAADFDPVFTPATVVPAAPISPFRFEAGLRYWYSSGEMKFGFANGDPLFGNPTSTIDWNQTDAHSGELFARIDHRPTGLFAKGMLGGGNIKAGEMIDRDFIVNQLSFSDTSSDVRDGHLRYGLIDAGWSFDVPNAPIRIGLFGGYQYWTSRMTAYGLRCNPDNLNNLFCPAGTSLVAPDTAVMVYEPTWHAARVGVDAKMMVTSQLSVSGEAAWIPYATLNNKDSHLLRQGMADLGPAPNIFTNSRDASGFAGEIFLNWHFMKNFELGAGLRYWEFSAHSTVVTFGPTHTPGFEGNRFIDQRYGVLLQLKGKI